MMKPQVFEKGDKVYIIAPVSPFTPGEAEIEEFAFAEQLKTMAPNSNLMWLRGQYVEADNPNQNGQMWTSGELAIKSLTPMLMPVTVMHDPRTAVGTIADTALRTPEADKVPRARIETSLALWAHRFPEVAEEAAHNYEAGSLMQSMECISPHYSCRECGQTFQKLADGAERKNWCAHLNEAGSAGGHTLGARILDNVVFTGTGLIFGSRGARGAYDEAHLEVFQEEVAESHEKAHHDRQSTKRKPKPRRVTRTMDPIEVTRDEYAELTQRPKAEELAAEKKRADEAEERAEAAEKKVEETETAKVAAEKRATEAEEKVTEAEEKANAETLRGERMGKLGKGFTEKLGDITKTRLNEQAAKMSDEDWSARLDELSELVGVKPDEGGTKDGKNDKGAKSEEFSREEVARSQVGGGGKQESGSGGDGEEPSDAQRGSVMRGLIPTASK